MQQLLLIFEVHERWLHRTIIAAFQFPKLILDPLPDSRHALQEAPRWTIFRALATSAFGKDPLGARRPLALTR